MATTQEQKSVEELGAEVSSSVLTPLRFLERSAAVWKDRPAVVSGEQTWTYAEHYDRVRRAAGAVRDELGIEAGDRVAVLLPNVAPMLELHYAVPGVGAVLVPLNTRLASPEYEYILEHCGAKVLIAYRGAAEGARPRAGGARRRRAAGRSGSRRATPTPTTSSCSPTPTRSTSSAPTTSAT